MKNLQITGSVPLFSPSHTQRGMVTVFIMLMLMLLMASMLSYSARNAISEQHMSANELRQKRAFHMAESGLELATEWMLANNVLINADVEDMLGSNIDGWMVAGSQRWTQCADVDYSADKSHPCWGESLDSRRDDSFFYQWQGSTKLPINAGTLAATSDTMVSVEALLCLVDIDLAIDPEIASPVLGCQTDPALVDSSKFLVTLLARGESDCLNGQCNAEVLVAKQVSNFSIVAFARAPGIPLVTKSSFPPSGTSEIVANPNAGGPGVPLSVWANSNNSCPAHPPVDPSSGSWATCEAWEWYGTHEVPAGITCNQPNCACTTDEAMSTSMGLSDIIGDDFLLDAGFPCDLFQYYFGVSRSAYRTIRDSVTVLGNCDSLGPASHGVYWISGPTCQIAANTVVGSPETPVFLISAAGVTRLAGGSSVYGTLFVTDVEDATSELRVSGGATVFGSVIADADLGHFTGTFQIVYNDGIVADASAAGALSGIHGGWIDYHKEWQ